MSLLDELESEMTEIMAARENSSVPSLIKQELARRRMSRASLADAAKISLSALEKGLGGQRSLSPTTLVRLEDVLGLNLRNSPATTAPDELGGYARAGISWLEGNYLTIRPSSKRPQDIVTYITDVTWDENLGHLVFAEKARLDAAYAQAGHVAVPHQTGHIYFTTNRHGQHRLMLLQRQATTGDMHGLLLTLQQEKGARLLPVSMPVALVPIANLKQPPALGAIGQSHKSYVELKAVLNRTIGEGFAGMLTG